MKAKKKIIKITQRALKKQIKAVEEAIKEKMKEGDLRGVNAMQKKLTNLRRALKRYKYRK